MVLFGLSLCVSFIIATLEENVHMDEEAEDHTWLRQHGEPGP